MATLIGLGLDSYVNGTLQAPSKMLLTDATKPNPTYQLWFLQDQTLLGALLGGCSDQIQHVISSAETSFQAFERMSASYARNSRSRIISLKSGLAHNPKGTRSVAEFLHDMQTIADDLALAESPVTDEDLVVHILGQLGDDFAHVSAALKMRDNPIKLPDLYTKLVDHERSLKASPNNPIIATVNQTQKTTSRPTNSRPISDTRGPSRFSSNGSWNARTSGQQTGNFYFPRARFLKENHITISMSSPTIPMVNTSSANSSSSTQGWMFDSGASHHVASDRSALHTLSDFGEPDEIMLGNGSTHGGASHAGNEH